MKEIAKTYAPKEYEDKIYKMWEISGAFKPDEDKKKKPYSIMMPPPNATGTLHLGHATMLAIEDILIRFKRMQGFAALYLPGTDHAAIATQSVVEKKLEAAGLAHPREKYGREGLLEEIRKFVEQSKSTIRTQIRKMGTSCDWSRERYTFSDDMNTAVNELFRLMYEDGLIYRGGRIVNWDPKMQTTVADDELEYLEEKAPFYYFKYGPVVISTARPETKFGDKIIVVHPKDKRYKNLIGKEFDVEWIEGIIKAKVIADECIDMSLGTGAMTITPAHSQVDFELAEKYHLEHPQIIDFEGKIRPEWSETCSGMDIKTARKKVVEILEKKGLVDHIDENYIHNVAVNYRGKGVVEPQIMKQWFVDVNKPVISWKKKKLSIKEVLQDTVRSKMIRIIPDRFEKIYFHWIDNLRDWCISRQIWWGHRVPVWYHTTCQVFDGNDEKDWECGLGQRSPFTEKPIIIVDKVFEDTMITCPHCKKDAVSDLRQDEDTLDTWFSAQLWTFSTLGWPEKTPDLLKFSPSNVLETGYDILFFWVARMILGTTYALRKSGFSEEQSIPFKDVYLHGLIRDIHGKKMSKSRPETCIDPLDMIEKYGTDAVRLSLIIGSTPGNDMRLYEEKIAGYRNFVNKIWNGARFVIMSTATSQGSTPVSGAPSDEIDLASLSRADKWILTRLNEIIERVTDQLEKYQLSEAGLTVYDFFWGEYCDWYVEMSKVVKNPAVLKHVLKTTLTLMHPFMPFVTEVIWAALRAAPAANESIKKEDMLIVAKWPKPNPKWNFPSESDEIGRIMDLIAGVRVLRAESGVDATKKIHAIIYAHEDTTLVQDKAEIIKRLANLGNLEIHENGEKIDKALTTFVGDIEIYLPLADLIDFNAEKARLGKEIQQLQVYIGTLEIKLKNKKFVQNAPKEVVKSERIKLQEATDRLSKIQKQLAQLTA